MKNLYFAVILLLFTANALAQHSSTYYQNLADSLYQIRHYQHAANYYEKALKKSTSPGGIMLKLGRSHSKLGEISQAEEWYTKAATHNADFGRDDAYEYAQILAMSGKRLEAQKILSQSMERHPATTKENEFLDDLRNNAKYYKDSSAYEVRPLSINTEVSEFAPAFYKNGIVYTSATPEHSAKRKYHWDNNHYLNLLFSDVIDGKFQKPVFFEKNLNTNLHDGPASFYNNFNSMIVNRNQSSGLKSESGSEVWHVSLLNARYSNQKATWEVEALPFDQPPYSFLHPNISEDGMLMYFVSDKPGGYGGTDIYRTTLVNGTWTEPYNLGPVVNTTANEVFPFFVDNTLYFSSNGHGGLGGLDIFQSEETPNGFIRPTNVGYPINSIKDDLSVILRANKQDGYFASSRNGNDDLFSVKRIKRDVPMIVHTYDGLSSESLAGAEVEVISAIVENISVRTDSLGNVSFHLPENSEFIIIGKRDDKIGMLYGNAPIVGEDKFRDVALFSDTTHVPAIGKIVGTDGNLASAKSITIVDLTTNQQIAHATDQSLINFPGQRGHEYKITVRNANGSESEKILKVDNEHQGTLEWSIELPVTESPNTISARIFKAEDESPLAGANVEILTFSESELRLVADNEGRVDFSLAVGAAYLLIAGNGSHSGMLSGIVENSDPAKKVIHPVPAFPDKSPLAKPFAMVLIMDEEGNILDDAIVDVTNDRTGSLTSFSRAGGLIQFSVRPDSTYLISVSKKGYKPYVQELHIDNDESGAVKLSISLQKLEVTSEVAYAAKVFRDTDNSVIDGATVTVIGNIGSDLELTADSAGIVKYHIPDNEPYLLVATKDNWVGTFIGLAEEKESSKYVIHPVAASQNMNKIVVVAQFVDQNGSSATPKSLQIVDALTGETLPYEEAGGLITFNGKPGSEYTIVVDDPNFKTMRRKVSLTQQSDNGVMKIQIGVERNNLQKKSDHLIMAVQVVDAKNRQPVGGAKLVVTSFDQADREYQASTTGESQFDMTLENDFLIIASSDTHIGMMTGRMDRSMDRSHRVHVIELNEEKAAEKVPVVAWLKGENGEPITEGKVVVKDAETKKVVMSTLSTNAVVFIGEKGKQYDVTVKRDGNTKTEKYLVSKNAGVGDKLQIVLPEQNAGALANKKVEESYVENKDRNLIIFTKEGEQPRIYVVEDKNLSEITETDGKLSLSSNGATQPLGEASQYIGNYDQLAARLNVPSANVIRLNNIYFDFNTATLDADDKKELFKVKSALEKLSSVQLTITAHADDRGRAQYNLQLSKKRARSVGMYLANLGLPKKRIVQIARGEETPEVICLNRECSEEDHQRNRRAEFGLSTASNLSFAAMNSSKREDATTTAKIALVKNDPASELRAVDTKGLTFKVSIGAYRYNSALQFEELKDIGTVESVQKSGITYYFLAGFSTWSDAEAAKAKVIERGIKDSQISCYYNGKKISMKEVTALKLAGSGK